MPVSRGDIVLVAVPDTSGNPGKVRPALVVSSNQMNHRSQDAIMSVITGTTKHVNLLAAQLLIEVRTPEGRQAGLLNDSAVKCERLHAVLQSIIRRKIGSLSAATMQKINQCLQASLELP